MELLPTTELKVWTDGACRANGYARASAGVGVFFFEGCSDNVGERFELDTPTNQRAELLAIQRALGVVLAKLLRPEWAAVLRTVRVVSDSEYSIKALSVWVISWEKRHWRRAGGGAVLNQDLIKPTYQLIQRLKAEFGVSILFQHVRGHSGDPGNDAADRLATSCIPPPCSSLPPATPRPRTPSPAAEIDTPEPLACRPALRRKRSITDRP